MLEPVVERYRERKLRRYFHADAAFAKPEIYEFLEAKGYAYATISFTFGCRMCYHFFA